MIAWTLTEANRPRITKAICEAPLWSRISLKGPRRSSEQNALMWLMLECFSDQVEHFGRKYDAETWKAIALHGFGKELQFVPSLDGESIVAIGYRTSELSKVEMSDFIEFLYSTGAALGVVFKERSP